jgi:hypothetical protein
MGTGLLIYNDFCWKNIQPTILWEPVRLSNNGKMQISYRRTVKIRLADGISYP